MLPMLVTAIRAKFYGTPAGKEPVRDWFLALPRDDRQVVGRTLRLVQLSWPVGMPLVRSLGGGLWEVRIGVRDGDVRVLIGFHREQLHFLHAFAKKTRKTPKPDLDLARSRFKEVIHAAKNESERDW